MTNDFLKYYDLETYLLEYCSAVKLAGPECDSLRGKDRFLWGRSAVRQLEHDIANGFSKGEFTSNTTPSDSPNTASH
jgi:hypothetical protein